MSAACHAVFAPDARLAPVAAGIRSSLPVSQRAAGYDRIAATYDAVVGNAVYNRLVWGCPVARYAQAAETLIAAAPTGPLLDLGCGSLVFTHAAYRPVADRLILFDRSLAMLSRGRRRLPQGQFVQGDAFAKPFKPGAFAGGCAWGMLHVFGTGSLFLDALASTVEPGAPIAISTLVLSDRRIGNAMLGLLHRQGEAARPETADAVRRAFDTLFVTDTVDQCGSMLFLTGRRR